MAEKPYQPKAVNYGQEPGKLNICRFGMLWTRNVSQRRFLFAIYDFPQVKSQEKHTKMPLLRYRGEKGAYMRTGLKNRKRPQDADSDTGCMEFEIAKGRFSFRLTAPYSEERRQAASDWAKKNGISAL